MLTTSDDAAATFAAAASTNERATAAARCALILEALEGANQQVPRKGKRSHSTRPVLMMPAAVPPQLMPPSLRWPATREPIANWSHPLRREQLNEIDSQIAGQNKICEDKGAAATSSAA